MAVRLAEQGTVEWSEFQSSLIEVVGEWDREQEREQEGEQERGHEKAAESGEDYPYFELFAEALSRLLVQSGFLEAQELTDRDQVLASRPHDHDH